MNRWLKDQTAAARAAAAQSSARTPTSPRPSPQPDLTSTPVETSTAAAASATAGGVQGISLRDAASSPSGKTAEGGAAGQQTAKPVRSVFANKWETSDGAGAGADSTAVAATDTVPESALAPLPTAPEPVIDAWTETRASGLSPRLPADGAVSSSSVQQQQQQSAEQPRSPSQPVRSIFADKWGSQSHPVPLANAAFGSISAVSSDSFSSAPGRGGLIGVGSVGGGAGGGSEGRKDATDERGEVESRPASPPRLLPRRRLPSPRPVRSIFADKWAGGGTSEPATSTPVTPTASDHGCAPISTQPGDDFVMYHSCFTFVRFALGSQTLQMAPLPGKHTLPLGCAMTYVCWRSAFCCNNTDYFPLQASHHRGMR